MTEWSHDGLADDLAAHLKAVSDTLIWTNMQLGPSGSPRPDVFLMHKSYVRPNPIAYECKVSRADFLSDVTSGKWISYLQYAYAVYFAVPAGMIDKREIPNKCGLMVRGETGWRALKKPTFDPHPIPEKAMLKLLIDGLQREGLCQRKQHWTSYYRNQEFDKKFGAEAARWVSDSVRIKEKVAQAEKTCQTMLEKAHEQCEKIRARALKDMPELWEKMVAVLGLEPGCNQYQIGGAIARLKQKRDDTAVHALKRVLDQLDTISYNNRRYTRPEPEDGEEGSPTTSAIAL